jgi:hypothetical protein
MLGHPFDIVQITHGDLSVSNMPTYRAVNPLTAADDAEEFGDCDVFMGLGVTSRASSALAMTAALSSTVR